MGFVDGEEGEEIGSPRMLKFFARRYEVMPEPAPGLTFLFSDPPPMPVFPLATEVSE